MNETKYVFWVELRNGEELRWPRLTQRQATSMHKWTEERTPLEVKAFGWEEMR